MKETVGNSVTKLIAIRGSGSATNRKPQGLVTSPTRSIDLTTTRITRTWTPHSPGKALLSLVLDREQLIDPPCDCRTQNTPSIAGQHGLPSQCYLCVSAGSSSTCGTACAGVRSTVDGSCCAAGSTANGCSTVAAYYDFCPNTQPGQGYAPAGSSISTESECRALCDHTACYSWQWLTEGTGGACYISTPYATNYAYNTYAGLDSAFSRYVTLSSFFLLCLKS